MSTSSGEALEIRLPAVTALEVGGPGVVKSGGGFIGGGFGLQGAAEGMAIASVLNSLTSTTRIETVFGVRSPDAGFVVALETETPAQLRIRLAGTIAAVEANTRNHATAGPDASSLSQQLAQLADLHASGALTDDEFAAAKARLLASP